MSPTGRPDVGRCIGKRAQLQSSFDAVATIGEQGSTFADRAGDSGSVHLEPAGQHVVGNAVPQANQCGKEPIDEDQLAPCARLNRPLTLSVEWVRRAHETNCATCLLVRTESWNARGRGFRSMYRRGAGPVAAALRRARVPDRRRAAGRRKRDGLDLFVVHVIPMTHHVGCVAILEPVAKGA